MPDTYFKISIYKIKAIITIWIKSNNCKRQYQITPMFLKIEVWKER